MQKLSFIEAFICADYHNHSLKVIQTFERFLSVKRTLALQLIGLILFSDILAPDLSGDFC
jgi:hypothetical protein